MSESSGFKSRVLNFIKKIPKGKVVSYGQVAAAAGSPRAARQVGGILKALGAGTEIPWWRVVNRNGEISIKGNWEFEKQQQANFLKSDGVLVNENFVLDMEKFCFK